MPSTPGNRVRSLLGIRRSNGDLRSVPVDEVRLATYLTSRTLAHWCVTRQGASAMPRSASGKVIAFHPEERRIATGPRSIEAAKSHVVREGLSSDRVRVVNRSRDRGLVYAAPVGYLESLVDGDASPPAVLQPEEARTAPGPSGMPQVDAVAPGLMLIDCLLEGAGDDRGMGRVHPFAVLVDLCAPADEASEVRLRRERLVIGVVFPDPETQPVVVCSVTDEPVKDVARLVLYEQKLSEDAPWILFNAADVLAAAPRVETYPAEPEWAGIPTRRMRHAALVASLLLAAGGAVYALEGMQRIRAAEASAREAKARGDQLQTELGALMRSRPAVLAGALGLDPLALLDRAGLLWRAGAKVALEARGPVSEYTITVPFVQPRMNFQNRPSAHSVTARARVSAVLEIEPPPGCVRSGLRATGALNEVSLVVRCNHPDSGLARFVPR